VAVSGAQEAEGTQAGSGRGEGRRSGGSRWHARCGHQAAARLGGGKRGLTGGPRLAVREGGRKGWHDGCWALVGQNGHAARVSELSFFLFFFSIKNINKNIFKYF
jgi:hypothetical protein